MTKAEPAAPTPANELRGEVDLELDGIRFVLRPSYEASLAVEKRTGKGLVALATAAADGALGLSESAAITTEFIRAWGRSTDDKIAANVDEGRIGALIHEYGLMRVTLRLAVVLTLAATGGVKNDGSPKQGEARAPATGMEETLDGALLGSLPLPSDGPRTTSGAARRASSGRRSKSGRK